ncbi:hypothetical protein V3C99_010665 [Haemonchus contortus]
MPRRPTRREKSFTGPHTLPKSWFRQGCVPREDAVDIRRPRCQNRQRLLPEDDSGRCSTLVGEFPLQRPPVDIPARFGARLQGQGRPSMVQERTPRLHLGRRMAGIVTGFKPTRL